MSDIVESDRILCSRLGNISFTFSPGSFIGTAGTVGTDSEADADAEEEAETEMAEEAEVVLISTSVVVVVVLIEEELRELQVVLELRLDLLSSSSLI